jgi:hypothetical protein
MASNAKTGYGVLWSVGYDGSSAHVNHPTDSASKVINDLECSHAVSFSKVRTGAVII